jgi:hypothetical protein
MNELQRIERLESIIKWLVNHPANKVVGDCIGGGWSCDSYPDDDGTRREYFAYNHEVAIEYAMEDSRGGPTVEDDVILAALTDLVALVRKQKFKQ